MTLMTSGVVVFGDNYLVAPPTRHVLGTVSPVTEHDRRFPTGRAEVRCEWMSIDMSGWSASDRKGALQGCLNTWASEDLGAVFRVETDDHRGWAMTRS